MTLSDIKARALQYLTESDNQTLCPVRAIILVALFVYHGAWAAGVCLGQMHLDPPTLSGYLRDMIYVIGASAGSIGVKSALKGDAQ